MDKSTKRLKLLSKLRGIPLDDLHCCNCEHIEEFVWARCPATKILNDAYDNWGRAVCDKFEKKKERKT